VSAGELDVLRWPQLDGCGVDAVVTTRHGGSSAGPYESLNLGLHVGDDAGAVVENRRRAAALIGLELGDLVFAEQVHGPGVAVVGRGDRGRGAHELAPAVPDVDALVTVEPGVGLAVLAADCTTLVLVDPDARVLGVAHAGWRGTTDGVVGAVVATMESQGAERSRLVVGLGPTVAAARFQVGADVVEPVADLLGPTADRYVRADGTGRWTFDLTGANVHLLQEAGVAADRIDVIDRDTAAGDLFSDRALRPCGRFAALARLS
jgi:polyphenol oxidase